MRYKGLDLNLLYALDVLLEVRNVSRAADRLGLSQSGLSAGLSRLREYFNDELLVLEGRRMHPTPFAEQLVRQLRVCLSATDALLSTSHTFAPETADRAFRIIASDYVITAILATLAQRFATIAPGIRLIYSSPDELATDRLTRGDMDILISPREFVAQSLPMEPLYDESFVIAGWRHNPIFARIVTREDVLAAGHIAVEIGGHRAISFADRHMQSLFPDLRVEASVSSFNVVPWMLEGTERLALMHRRLARTMAAYLPLAFADLPFEFPTMQEMVQYHHTRANDVGVRWLIEEIRSLANEVSRK